MSLCVDSHWLISLHHYTIFLTHTHTHSETNTWPGGFSADCAVNHLYDIFLLHCRILRAN